MIPTRESRSLSQTLEWLGIPVRDSNGQQLEVLAAAMDIYEERSRVRGETWAEFDYHDCIHHLRSKLARLQNAAQLLARLGATSGDPAVDPDETRDRYDELVDAMEDDALDVINYAAFLVRHLTGRKPVNAIG